MGIHSVNFRQPNGDTGGRTDGRTDGGTSIFQRCMTVMVNKATSIEHSLLDLNINMYS